MEKSHAQQTVPHLDHNTNYQEIYNHSVSGLRLCCWGRFIEYIYIYIYTHTHIYIYIKCFIFPVDTSLEPQRPTTLNSSYHTTNKTDIIESLNASRFGALDRRLNESRKTWKTPRKYVSNELNNNVV